jgi:hypothetical protein
MIYIVIAMVAAFLLACGLVAYIRNSQTTFEIKEDDNDSSRTD